MKLSAEARSILDTSMRQRRVSDAERTEIEDLVARMPDDVVFLYKNVESNPIGDLPRYNIHIRLQHMMIFVSFLLLAFTGLPVHFADTFWAAPIIQALGGLEVTRVAHRTFAAIMIFGMVYHLVTITIFPLGEILARRFDYRRTILPFFKDVRDFKDDMLYFAGQRMSRPEMDKYMYKQKMHYFAAGFGNLVMTISGSAFLFPEFWAAVLPGDLASAFQDLMRHMHPHEAVLALLVIAFWHWYNVHLAPGRFPMQWTFLTGKITREHQMEEHFLEYLRCLVELPDERRFLADVLRRLEERDGAGESAGVPGGAIAEREQP